MESLSNVSNFTFTSKSQLLQNVYLYLVRHVKIHKNKSHPFTWKTNVCILNTKVVITLISTFHQPIYANYSYLYNAVTVFTVKCSKCFKFLYTYCTYILKKYSTWIFFTTMFYNHMNCNLLQSFSKTISTLQKQNYNKHFTYSNMKCFYHVI